VEAIQAAQDLGYPVVTKPLDGNHGRGVSIGLRTPEEVTAGFTAAASEGSAVLIERQFVGKDYRILAVNGEVVAVAERVPAHVTGDGKLTVAALIEKTNSDPRRGMGHENVLTKIKVDEHLLAQLAKQNLTLDSIPPVGSHVGLRQAANLSTGGTAIDRTEVIHPENASFAARAARILGLDIAGIDFVAPDITRSVRETGGGIVEVNASPGFRMHLQPSEGPPRNVAKNVIDMLFPKSSPARIPVFAITGTNGKSTTAQMLAHILQNHGQRVGLTTTTGVYVGGERILKSDASGPRSARMILQDPSVDVAVLESARGGILREGLAFDECDVGAVLNIAPDHLGLDEVDTLSQLAAVKSVVVESVYRNGCSVLNADDEYTFDMRRHAKGRIAFFSMRPLTSFLEEHAAGGGIVVIHEDGNIVVYNHGERTRLMAAGDIPATLGGLADFNIQNALAATAMCVGHGLPESAIRSGLATFGSSFRQCPGRLNVHDGHGFRVIVDYAHNPDALKALGTVVQKLRSTHSRVIGMVCIPGDRRDDDIRQMGAIAANIFDQLLLVEDEDNRGRPAGQTLGLLKEGALAAGCSEDRITISSGEALAVKDALTRAASGDLVILIGAFIERIWQEVQDHGKPTEVHGVEPVKVLH